MIYSFDVFDTLITRRTATPKGIFMLLQDFIKRGGYSSFLADNFYELRIGAETLARACALSGGKQEITLDDIYIALSTTACITEKQWLALKKLEIETEYNNVLGVMKNIEWLKELLNRGEHVVLISDMYLGETSIRYMLEKVDPVFKEIPLYVSSDYGVTKSGGLFQVVRDRENVDYSGWVHYGDDENTDIKPAKMLGIRAVRMEPEMIKEYEQPQKDLYHQISVGVSKYIRWLHVEDVVCEVGSSLAGPILYPYIRWVLEESMARGIQRLYFVARDGWILQQIADRIIQIEHYSIKTHYIYGSRKAWRLSSYEGSVEDLENLLRWSNMDEVLCLNDLASVFQLEAEDLKRFLPDQYRERGGKGRLEKIEKDYLCRQLRDNIDFRDYLVQSQKEKQQLVIKYLKQEMDVSDDKFAFVELAGTGFTQRCLANMIGHFYHGEIRNFYFKLDYIQENGQCRFINFYPSRMQRSYMLELLCRAPHGQTESYTEQNGRIVPVMELVEGKQISAYGLEKYKDAVIAYVNQMEYSLIGNGLFCTAQIKIAQEYLNIIAENPPTRVAEYFRYMPFSSGGRNSTIVAFAPPVTKKQLREIYFWRNAENFRTVYEGDTLDYALMISPEAMQYRKKCQIYSKKKSVKWLIAWNRYMHTRQKCGTAFFCPWELLRGNIVIYGAGRVGQAYVKQARQRRAKCNSLLWVDSDYVRMQAEGINVKAPKEIENYSFDRIIVAVHNDSAKQEIEKKLQEMGIKAEKIYYG